VTTSEAKRHDLYNALSETIGPDRADTLMAYLPSTEAANLATGSDIADLRADIRALRSDIRSELRSETSGLGDRIDAVNQRLDRLFLMLTAGLIAIVGTVFVQSII
jgi:hypothetical protein